mgnify:FL=1
MMKSPGRWGLTVVNVLPVEQYLYGVVGKEMSPSWSEEALKAQAVAARTYAIAHKSRFSQRGFDLTDDTSSQVYAGINGESPSIIKAVNATKGEIITYQAGLSTPFSAPLPAAGRKTVKMSGAPISRICAVSAMPAMPCRGIAGR